MQVLPARYLSGWQCLPLLTLTRPIDASSALQILLQGKPRRAARLQCTNDIRATANSVQNVLLHTIYRMGVESTEAILIMQWDLAGALTTRDKTRCSTPTPRCPSTHELPSSIQMTTLVAASSMRTITSPIRATDTTAHINKATQPSTRPLPRSSVLLQTIHSSPNRRWTTFELP